MQAKRKKSKSLQEKYQKATSTIYRGVYVFHDFSRDLTLSSWCSLDFFSELLRHSFGIFTSRILWKVLLFQVKFLEEFRRNNIRKGCWAYLELNIFSNINVFEKKNQGKKKKEKNLKFLIILQKELLRNSSMQLCDKLLKKFWKELRRTSGGTFQRKLRKK